MNFTLNNSDTHAPAAFVVVKALRLLFSLPEDILSDFSSEQEGSTLNAPAVLSFDCTPGNLQTLSRAGFRHMHRFVVLPSLQKARWLMPDGNPRQAVRGLRLYTPFSTRTRILKALGAGAAAADFPGARYSRVLVASRETLPIENLVRALTQQTRVGFAISIGTPGTCQKLTVQAMSSTGEILAYIKLPIGPEAHLRLAAEAAALERLWQFPKMRARVPRLLHSSGWGESCILVQSSLRGAAGPSLLSRRHEEFLSALQSCGSMERSADSLINEISGAWKRLAARLGPSWHDLARETLRTAARELAGHRVPCAPMHGDFAPWNSRSHAGQLSFFDWESVSWNAPRDWDRYHFLTQTKSLVDKGPGPETLPQTKNGSRASFMLYLLYSAAQLAAEGSAPGALTYREQLLRCQLSGEAGSAHTNISTIGSFAARDPRLAQEE